MSNKISDQNVAPLEHKHDAQTAVNALSEVIAEMKASSGKSITGQFKPVTSIHLPGLTIDGFDIPREANNTKPANDKSHNLRAEVESPVTPTEQPKKSFNGEIRIEDGSIAYTVDGGKVLDKNGKHFANLNTDGTIKVKNADSDVNRELVKGLRFEGSENGKRRVFETSESMCEGKIFLPGKDGKPVEYEVRMGMILDKKTGEQIGVLKAPGESADGKLAGGSILRIDTNEEVALRDIKGAVFDLHLMGQRKDVYIKGAALGPADGKNADTGLFNIGGIQAKETDLIGRAHKATKEGSQELKQDAEFVIKRAANLHKTLGEMLEKGTSPDATFVKNVESQLNMADGTLKGDKLAREKHRIDTDPPKLEDLPKDTSKINGWIKLPVVESSGKPCKQLEIKNGLIMSEDGKTAIGRIDDADGRITIIDASTGRMAQTTIKDMMGSVWHMEFPGKDGKTSESVNWIALGSEGGVRSVADLKRKGHAEVYLAECANKELGETFKSKLLAGQAETFNIDYQRKLDNIIKNGVQSQGDLNFVKAGAKEFVRPEGYRDQAKPEAPSIEIPQLNKDNVSQVNGKLRIGPESFAIVKGELYQLESKNGELVRAEKPCGKLGPGYTVAIDGREPISLADQNRVLMQFTVPGDPREHRIIGLGAGHASETGKWQRGGLVEADQLLNEAGHAYIAALNSNSKYFEERPWTTGALGNAAIGDREGLLKDFARQMEKENNYLKENISELFSDKGFDPSKQSNTAIDHAVSSSEKLLTNLGWRSKTTEDLSRDGIEMQKLVNTSTTMVATTVLTAGMGHVLTAMAAAGRITQGTAYVLEFGSSAAIGAGVKTIGQASETSNWKDNAASGALEGASMAFGSILGKQLGSLSSLKNVKEALQLQQAGKALSAEQTALVNTVMGRLTKAGYSEAAIKSAFLSTKGGDAVVRSTAMNAASSIQSGDWSNFNAKNIAAGAAIDVVAGALGNGTKSVVGKVGAGEKGVVARMVDDMAQSYSNSAMSEVQNAVNQERQRIAKEMGVTPDMVSDETLNRKINWNNVAAKVNEAGINSMVTSPLMTIASHPFVKMGEHLAKKPVHNEGSEGAHKSATVQPSNPLEAHAQKANAQKANTQEAAAPAPRPDAVKVKTGDKVSLQGEKFDVVFAGGGEAILHQKGRGKNDAIISTRVTGEEFAKYEKYTVAGSDYYRKPNDSQMYVALPTKDGAQLIPVKDVVVVKTGDISAKMTDHATTPKPQQADGTFKTRDGVTYDKKADGTIVRSDGLEIVHFKPNGETEIHADPRLFAVHGAVSPEFVAKVEKAYLALPRSLRAMLAENGQKVHLGRFTTEVRPDLKGVQPRGWQPGDTWTCVDGLHASDRREIVVAEKVRTKGWLFDRYIKLDRGEGVLRHEVGHAVDQAFNFFSKSPEFQAAYEKDIAAHVSKLPENIRQRFEYFLQTKDGSQKLGSQAGQSEIFAEMLGIMYGGGGSKYMQKELPNLFPNVKKLMETKLARYK